MDRRFYTGKKKETLSDMVELETINRMITPNYPRRPIVWVFGGGRGIRGAVGPHRKGSRDTTKIVDKIDST